MGQVKTKRIAGTARKEEEAYLAETLAVVQDNVENYGREVARMQEDIDEMLEHFHDNDTEVLTILNNTITMHDHMKRALSRNEKALTKPYFGRIVFHDKALNKEESLYIGRGGISKDSTHWMVVDWRAPVANAYYENGLGKCSYPAPDGSRIKIDLQLKRTYEIEDGKLKDYFDTEVIANDDLLTKYLAKNKQAVLGEIIATIQKEQNDIIRKTPHHNIIVQGVAGSGKTTVAMHRISFILYNYQERFKPEDFYIVGSNRILLDYITGVLPDLDVYGIRQMTMEQLFVRLLYEDWDENKYRIAESDKMGNRGAVRGTLRWFHDLEDFCRRMEWNVIPREAVLLNPKQFVEGLRDGKQGVFDETIGKPVNPADWIVLVDRDTIERYITQNPTISVQSKIDMLNERLQVKVKEEFLYRGVKYTENERKAITKAYRNRYGAKKWKRSIFEIYREFLIEQKEKGFEVDLPENEFDVYDLAALAYIYKQIKETEIISEAHHVVIDEAQDYGMMAYSVLKYCIKDCTYTVMGDVSQNIHFGYGLNDWEELKELLLTDEQDSFGVLKKSYRNTVEISNFATDILHHGSFSSYPVEPIIRHGTPVLVKQEANRQQLLQKAATICKGWQEKGLTTIAVICRSRETAVQTAKELQEYLPVQEFDPEKAVFGNGIMVMSVDYTKGLEFDAVMILEPTREEYPVDDGHAKLLYVAATRALHELCVLHREDLTGLIADPLPKEKLEKKPTAADGMSMTGKQTVVSTGKQTAVSKKRISIVRNPAAGAGDPEAQKPVAPEPSVQKPSVQKPVEQKPAVQKPVAPEPSVQEPSVQKPVAQKPLEQKPAVQKSAVQKPLAQRPGVQKPERQAPSQPYAVTAQNRPTAHMATRPAAKPTAAPGAAFSIGRPQIRSINKPLTSGSSMYGSGSLGSSAKSGSDCAAGKNGSGFGSISFGDLPSTDKLRPAGHSKIDLGILWAEKKPDGLYLQSRYGVLRISPVGSAIVRITFARGMQLTPGVHPDITVNRVDKAWQYKDSVKKVELTTGELCLQVDKATGAIRYQTRDKKLLLAERAKECRQIDVVSNKSNTWLFLDWAKGEQLYGMGTKEKGGISLRGTAKYISHAAKIGELPFLLSDKGYGILMATSHPAICCDIPVYGSYLYTENEAQMDFYFIAGKKPETILGAYAFLCGKL